MPRANLKSVVRYVRRALGAPNAPASTDAQLLQLFCAQRDEEAFAALVYRHGGLVRAVCSRVLHHDQDAEDAFQATFLVFASKAHSIRKGVSVVSWLHGVAYRVAMNAKRARRQPVLDSSATAGRSQDEPSIAAALREAQAIVDDELNKLPEKYRAPFVLCCLEGKGRAEAAAELGLLEGTVSSRMARARKHLQQRLTRRGIVLSAALCAIDVTRSSAPAIGPAFADRTAKAAISFAAGLAGTSGSASAPVIALAKGVLVAMSTTSKLKIATALLLTFGFLTATGAIARQVLAPAASDPQLANSQAPVLAQEPIAGQNPVQPPVSAKIDGPPTGQDFTGTIYRVFKRQVSFRKLQDPPSQVSTLPLAPDAKIFEGIVNGPAGVIEAGPAIQGGLENEQLRQALATSLLARIITDPSSQSIKEIHLLIGNDFPGVRPAPLRAPTGPRGEADSDSLPSHAVARFGSLRFRHDLLHDKFSGANVPQMTVSRDGKLIASARSNVVRIWETETGRKQYEWSFPEPLAGPRSRPGLFGGGDDQPLAFSPDGKHLAMYCDSSLLRILAVETGTTAKEIKLGEPQADRQAGRFLEFRARRATGGFGHVIPYLAYLPDGKRIIVEDLAGARARLLNLENGADLETFRGSSDLTSAVALSPDGKAFAIAAKDGTTRIWDVATGQERKPVKGSGNAIAFSPDSRVLAIADGFVRLWDASSGILLHTLAPRAPQGADRAGGGGQITKDRFGEWRLGGAYGLAFSPDGKQLATAHPWWVVLWDPVTGTELRRLRAEDGDAVSFLPDSRTLFLAGRNTFRFFDTATGSPIHLHEGHQIGITAIAYAPDGKQIATAATGLNHGELFVWEVNSRHVVLQSDGWTLVQPNLAYAPRGSTLAATHGETVLVWDSQTGKQRFMIPGQSQIRGPTTLAISNDGARLAFASSLAWATLYDLATGKELESLGKGDLSFYTKAFSPDLRLAAAISTAHRGEVRITPRSFQLFDFQTGKEWKSLAGSRASGAGSPASSNLVFSPNGRTLLEAHEIGQIVLNEIASGKPQLEIPVPRTSALAFSPDGRRLAFAEEEPAGLRNAREDDSNAVFPIRIVDLATGRMSAPLTGHRGTINGLAFSPDGKSLASASNDTTALLWDLAGLLPEASETPLTADQRNSAWADLAGDAKQAYQSMWKLAADPGAIDLFRKELKPAVAPSDPGLVRRLLADLASNDSAIRASAKKQLTQQGVAVFPELRRVLEGNPPAEVRGFLEELLETMQGLQLRGFRAIEVLERMKTPAAQELIRNLASGWEEAPLTHEAKHPLSGIILFGQASAKREPVPVSPQSGPNVAAKTQKAALPDKEKSAVQAIERLGGRYTTDPEGGGHIVTVNLIGTNTADADLKELKDLENIQALYLGLTKITDTGLEELKAFKNLRTLGLVGTQITDAGAKKLQEALPECQFIRGNRSREK